MPILNEKFPPFSTDHPLASGSLMVCGVTITIALMLTLSGLLRSKLRVQDGSST